MAGSRPEVRQDVLERLEPGVIVKAESLAELREQLGIDPCAISTTQFSKAVRSLHYNHGLVVYGRIWTDDPRAQTKGHYLTRR